MSHLQLPAACAIGDIGIARKPSVTPFLASVVDAVMRSCCGVAQVAGSCRWDMLYTLLVSGWSVGWQWRDGVGTALLAISLLLWLKPFAESNPVSATVAATSPLFGIPGACTSGMADHAILLATF